MKDDEIRQALGARIKDLRKIKSLTQKELAFKLDVRLSQVNKYESGLHVPPVEKLIQLSELFETTLDFLVKGEAPDESALHNKRLIGRMQALQDFENEDQEAILRLIDAVIFKQRIEGSIQSLETLKPSRSSAGRHKSGRAKLTRGRSKT